MALQLIHVKVVQVGNRSVYNIAKLKVSFKLSNFYINSYQYMYLVSKPAPPFEGLAVINGEFKEISLSDFKDKYLVLLFYPLDL